MAEFEYDVLVSRNFPILSKEDQQKIRQSRLLIAGCGAIGSVTALFAARIGFGRMILVDADIVELKNLNRQGFVFDDVGSNKAQALARHVQDINPNCVLDVLPHFLGPDNVEELVARADVIIDAIDMLAPEAIELLHAESRKRRKCVVAPFNFGWSGAVVVIGPESPGIADLMRMATGSLDNVLDENLLTRVQSTLGQIPEYFAKYGQDVTIGESRKLPHTVTGVHQGSALAIVAAVRLALGQPVAISPQFVIMDPWTALNPA